MNISQTWIIVSIVILAIVAVLIFFISKDREENRLSPLASLAFAFVLAGLIFGNDRLIGYGLLGVGLVLAVIDMLSRSKSKQP